MKNALVTIARDESAAGNTWAALTVQLAADTLTTAEVLTAHPRTTIDVARLHSPAAAATLHEAIRGHRAAVSAAISDPAARTDLAAALEDPELADGPLEPADLGSFRESFLGGETPATALEQRTATALRYRQLAARLAAMGDTAAAERTLAVADRAAFEAHHLNECIELGDEVLPLLHTAVLLADHLASEGAAAGTAPGTAPGTATARHRGVLTAATLTEEPIGWEPVPGLDG